MVQRKYSASEIIRLDISGELGRSCCPGSALSEEEVFGGEEPGTTSAVGGEPVLTGGDSGLIGGELGLIGGGEIALVAGGDRGL